MNINVSVPFLIKFVGHYCEVCRSRDYVVTTSSGLPSSRRWRVLYFVKVINICISFSSSDLVISCSVIFCLVTIGNGLSYSPNPSARAGYDSRSIFKQSLTGLNSEYSFSLTSCPTKAEEPSLPYYLPIAGGRT